MLHALGHGNVLSGGRAVGSSSLPIVLTFTLPAVSDETVQVATLTCSADTTHVAVTESATPPAYPGAEWVEYNPASPPEVTTASDGNVTFYAHAHSPGGSSATPLNAACLVLPGYIADLWAGHGETKSGNYLTNWADQSGAGNDVAQSNESYQPTCTTDEGSASVLFDGANDYLSRNYTAALNSAYMTEAIVLRQAPSVAAYFTLGITHTNDVGGDAYWDSGGSIVYPYPFTDSGNTPDTSRHLLISRIKGAGSTIRLDGSVVATGTCTIDTTDTTTGHYVGSRQNLVTKSKGHIFRIIRCNQALSDNAQAALEEYLLALFPLA